MNTSAYAEIAEKFLWETPASGYGAVFAPDAVVHLAKDAETQRALPAEKWVEELGPDFRFSNPFENLGIRPIFTPVTDLWPNMIMAKAYVEDAALAERDRHWTLEFTFDAGGKITLLRALDGAGGFQDHYRRQYEKGRFQNSPAYEARFSPEQIQAVNLTTLDRWWRCKHNLRAYQRRILITEDAYIADDFAMLVLDEKGDFVRGWLNPEDKHFVKWGFYDKSLAHDPTRLYHCPDMPNVYFAEAYGSGANDKGDPVLSHYFIQISFRDGLIVNFNEQLHNLYRLEK